MWRRLYSPVQQVAAAQGLLKVTNRNACPTPASARCLVEKAVARQRKLADDEAEREQGRLGERYI
jgi:hypothetical protein